MTTPTPAAQTALRYQVEVHEQGRVELQLPFPSGERVTIIVIPECPEQFPDLLAAASSSLDFWDNPLDDEDWNAASLRRYCPDSGTLY